MPARMREGPTQSILCKHFINIFAPLDPAITTSGTLFKNNKYFS